MATAGETIRNAAEAAAETIHEAAGAATDAAEEFLGGEGQEDTAKNDGWSFWFRALMTFVAVAAVYVASKVVRGESPEQRRLRLRSERRSIRKSRQNGPDDVDKLLSSIVRRQPGQAPPPGTVPISGPRASKGIPAGNAGRGAGAMTTAARAAAAGRGNGAGRGPTPPGVGDSTPKLRWNQTNEEVEIVIRVDPKVARDDVKVDVTATTLQLSLRRQVIISGLLYKPVDQEGCTWQIEDQGPGTPKEVTITLLKAEPSTSRENWWRVPLKGLENRMPPPRRPQQPADPEMVRKAIEAIKAKEGVGAKPLGKAGIKAAAGQATAPGADAGGGATAAGAANPTGAAIGATGGGAGATAPAAPTGGVSSTAKPEKKSGGKKKNRKKK